MKGDSARIRLGSLVLRRILYPYCTNVGFIHDIERDPREGILIYWVWWCDFSPRWSEAEWYEREDVEVLAP